ncbi:hypothetical protein ACE5IS_12970 [Leptospira wolffii]|uniref:Lipoprotein n=1 Tax=Leptospira wolffii TaxID=409998 RepID=A0ABV5BPW1_9LEPT
MTNYPNVLILCVCLALFPSCIAITYGVTSLPDSFRKENQRAKKRELFITISSEFFLNGKKKEMDENTARNRIKLVKDVYVHSNLFVLQDKETKGGTRIHVTITEIGSANQGIAMLTGLSFGLIPSWASSDFYVTTIYMDEQGRTLAEIVTKGSQLYLFHLGLLPFTPFLFPFSKVDDLIIEMNDQSINEAIQRGMLQVY